MLVSYKHCAAVKLLVRNDSLDAARRYVKNPQVSVNSELALGIVQVVDWHLSTGSREPSGSSIRCLLINLLHISCYKHLCMPMVHTTYSVAIPQEQRRSSVISIVVQNLEATQQGEGGHIQASRCHSSPRLIDSSILQDSVSRKAC